MAAEVSREHVRCIEREEREGVGDGGIESQVDLRHIEEQENAGVNSDASADAEVEGQERNRSAVQREFPSKKITALSFLSFLPHVPLDVHLSREISRRPSSMSPHAHETLSNSSRYAF
jgi:hypothetical protein